MVKSKKGFTLIELCVVMAIAAIIGTMVFTFILFSSNQQKEITDEAKCIAEVTEVQKVIHNWIKKYDSSNYSFTADSNTITAKKKTTSEEASKLYFDDSKIFETGSAKTGKLNNIDSITFRQPTYTKGIETEPEQIIEATVTYKSKNKSKAKDTQILLFSLFSDITRTRKVEDR